MFLKTEWKQYYLPMIKELRKLIDLHKPIVTFGIPDSSEWLRQCLAFRSLIECQIGSQVTILSPN